MSGNSDPNHTRETLDFPKDTAVDNLASRQGGGWSRSVSSKRPQRFRVDIHWWTRKPLCGSSVRVPNSAVKLMVLYIHCILINISFFTRSNFLIKNVPKPVLVLEYVGVNKLYWWEGRVGVCGGRRGLIDVSTSWRGVSRKTS